jgi:hypothetical protein
LCRIIPTPGASGCRDRLVIYAERLVGVRFRKSPGCGELFEIGSRQAKTYHDPKCKEKVKKQNQRKKRKAADEEANLKAEVNQLANRRGSGEDSIYKRRDGRWCAQVSLGYKPGGKPHRKLLYGKTRSQVSEALKRTLRDQQLGLAITSDRQTVARF